MLVVIKRPFRQRGGGVEPLTSTGDVVGRGRALLNPNDPPSAEEAEAGESGGCSPPPSFPERGCVSAIGESGSSA